MSVETSLKQNCMDYERVEKAINFLAENVDAQPSLKNLTESIGVSEYHIQKMFSRWAGISPKRFLQYLTKEYAKSLLDKHSVLDASVIVGLSSKSRLHDLLLNCEGITPGEYKKQGEGIVIRYGVHPTPFGRCLIAITSRGICKLAFLDHTEGDEQNKINELYAEWSRASILLDQAETENVINDIFLPKSDKPKPLHLFLKGTNFQLKVWEALMNVPAGHLVAYETIAQMVEIPNGNRAVGSAVGKNPIALLIPCHRVIRKSGEINQYRWGTGRKKAIIGWESAQLVS